MEIAKIESDDSIIEARRDGIVVLQKANGAANETGVSISWPMVFRLMMMAYPDLAYKVARLQRVLTKEV